LTAIDLVLAQFAKGMKRSSVEFLSRLKRRN